MILQLLCQYYDRLQQDTDVDIPEIGFSQEKISFVIVIDKNGTMVGGKPQDIRETNEKGKPSPRTLFVPKIKGRSGKNPPPYFLWDNAKYVLGGGEKKTEERDHKDDKYKLTEDRFFSFKEWIQDFFQNCDDEGVKAIIKFLNSWEVERSLTLENWEEIYKANFVFKLDTDFCFLHEREIIKQLWVQHAKNELSTGDIGYCLISGEKDTIAPTHPLIKGVQGGKSTGGAIIAFNIPSFVSYNKKQNFNSPISEVNAFKYTTALNHLCRFGSSQKIQIGDATTVFWAEKENRMESMFGKVLSQSNDGFDKDVKLFLESIQKGKKPVYVNGNTQFFILGLSPNAARLSVRFWHVSDVEDISHKLMLHFSDLKIEKREDDSEFPSIWHLLIELVPSRKGEKRKTDAIPPNLAGQMIRAVLNGSKYPESFYTTLISRIKTDQQINYMRAAIIKAVLTRKYRFKNIKKEVSVALDKENKNVSYLLGRLFSVLEKAQQDAIPGANTTIKDRYYGSASSTPKVVFPQLMKLANHHISKAKYGNVSDKWIEEIVQDINVFPAHLTLEGQGEFALGYYHQRNELFKKKEKKGEE
ncbi:MAG: type I-C CRISPR-associated protein Cas8c/Csd1 [Desulfobacteraceae bacterium]|nr:type I-C CRISPR-associated protein Cas8c/Csd1 [Desulfobacteraceae bacterium]